MLERAQQAELLPSELALGALGVELQVWKILSTSLTSDQL